MTIRETINDLRQYRSLILVVFVFCMMATLSFLSARGMQKSSAASLSGFNPGNIISDAVMSNYNSMSVEDIQKFLSSKNKCQNTNYNQYLSLKASYPNTDWHFDNGHFVCLSEERFGDGTVIGQGQTAAEIIYQAAQDYKINPQVILVLLQKEQGLITDTYPNSRQYRSATGYGCPDTAACDAKYYGFKNQVRNAAALFRDVLNRGYAAYPEKTKGVYIGYNPNYNCGRSEVYIENRATAALYRYTPYQPNSAALAAGYGTGDTCSAYGNRNFYLYFTDWFGSTQASVDGEPIVIPDGEYSLIPAVSGNRALNANNGNAELNQLNEANKAQRWKLKRDASGYYTLTNVATGQLLDLAGGQLSNGTNVGLWSGNNTCSQQWKIYQTKDRRLVLESGCGAGMVLDVLAGFSDIGTNIQLYTVNNTISQEWQLRAGQTIPNDIYTINSYSDSAKVAEIAGGSTAKGTNIQLYTNNQTLSQKWYFSYNPSTGYYTIINPLSGKAVDVAYGVMQNGTNVWLYDTNNTCSQQWHIVESNGRYTIASACSPNMVLELANNQTTNGGNIRLQSYQANTPSELWKVTPQTHLADGQYSLAVRLDNNKLADGTNNDVRIHEDNASSPQKWTIKRDPSTGYYTIINPLSGKAVDVAYGVMQNGTNVWLYDTNNTCSQQWHIVESSSQHYTIFSACTINYALDLTYGITANNTNIQLYSANGTVSQEWLIKRQY